MQQRLMGRIVAPVVLALGLALIAPMMAMAAPTPSIIGVIDMAKIRTDFKGWKAAQTRMDTVSREKQSVYDDLEKGKGLTPEQFKEYVGLAGDVVKINPIRIKELQDLSKKNADELAELSAKIDEMAGLKARVDDKTRPLTDAEKARLAVLTNEITADKTMRMEKLDGDAKQVTQLINAEGTKLYQQLQDEGERLSKALDEIVEKGIGKVAEAKKLAVVLAKDIPVGENATERLVRWGGTDITEEVIKGLNDSFKDSMLDAPNR